MAETMILSTKRRGGVGGIGSKSSNFKELNRANIRRNAKIDRINKKAEEAYRQKL